MEVNCGTRNEQDASTSSSSSNSLRIPMSSDTVKEEDRGSSIKYEESRHDCPQDDMSKFSTVFKKIEDFFDKCNNASIVYLSEENHQCIFPCIDFLKSELKLEAVYIDLNYRPFVQYADFIAIVAFQDMFPERVSKFEKSSNFSAESLFSKFENNGIVDKIRSLPIDEQELVLQGACQILTFNYLVKNEEKEFCSILKSFDRELTGHK